MRKDSFLPPTALSRGMPLAIAPLQSLPLVRRTLAVSSTCKSRRHGAVVEDRSVCCGDKAHSIGQIP